MALNEFETAVRRLAAIVESSDDAIVSKDLTGTIMSWNRAAERMFGYTAAEALGKSIRIIIPADRQSEEDEVLSRIGRGESIEHFETIRQRKDGTLLPISLTVSPIRDTSGRVVGASKIARDISDRKRTESELLKAHEMGQDLQRRLLAIVAASGSLLLSPRVDHVVPAVLHLAEQLIAADAYAIWTFERIPKVWTLRASHGLSEALLRDLVPATTPFAEPLLIDDVGRDPRTVDRADAFRREGIVSLLAIPLTIDREPSGSLAFYCHSPRGFSDTEMQTAVALGNLASAAITTAELYDAQRRSRIRSDFLAEAGAVLSASFDYEETLKGVVKLAVPDFADWCAADLVNEGRELRRLAVASADPSSPRSSRFLSDVDPAHPESPYSVAHVIRRGRPVMVEHVPPEGQSPNGDSDQLHAMREFGVTSAIIVPLSAHGRILGALTFVTAQSGRHYTSSDLQFAADVASRAALAVENALAYDEARRANQLKDDFLATLSHELRTPLNAIVGYARMLNAGMLTTEKQTRAFDIVEKNASALTQIVEDVLDVSRIVAGKLRLNVTRVDLPAVLTHSIETVQPGADAKGVRLQAIVDPRAAPIAGDPDRLQQVLWNLLSNAVKFTPRGGRVQASVSRVNSHVEVVVSDTGIGIAPEFLPHIFERFRQADSRFAREHGGLGLGLAIVRHIVEMHGGTISAMSDGLGHGATFRVQLPTMIVHADALPEHERVHSPLDVDTAPQPLIRLDGIHVLAVDDDADALMLLREVLESAGARVTTADSAERALSSIDAAHPDVLLSDVGMPGVDGLELISRVRQDMAGTFAGLPAAAITAYARSEDRTRALRAGFQMHLAKPIDPTELLAVVSALARR